MKKIILAALAASFAVPALAAPIITVNTTDDIYGSFNGSIQQGAVGAAATLSWKSAGYYWGGSIGLTDAGGTTLYQITTNFDDTYNLFAAGSGNAAIGTSCSGNNSACVVVPVGQQVSLYSTINSLNGGSGICCGGSNVFVTNAVSGAVPEPASWAMMVGGFGLMGAALRRKKASVSFA